MQHVVSFLVALGVIATSPHPAQQARGRDASPSLAAPAPFQSVTALDPAIWHVFQDSKGTYWFGSHGAGLYRWRPGAKTFDLFTKESGLPGEDIGRIQEDRSGRLFINTNSGICTFDGRAFTTLQLDESQPVLTEWKPGPDDVWLMAGGNEPHAVFHDGKSLRRLRIPATPAGDAHFAMYPRSQYPNIRYSPYDAYTIYRDARGHVWFGTASLGACRFDGKTFAWIGEKELGFDERDGQTFGTRSIIEDRDGAFWITVTRHRFDMSPPASGTRSLNAGGLSYEQLPGLPQPRDGADEGYTYVMSMTKDRAGDLWMATYGAGAWQYDGKTLTNHRVLVEGQPITIFSITCDREGVLWLGTHEHGAMRFNGKIFEKFVLR